MSVDLLNTILARPLEREFEGWITWKMLDYFDEVGRDVRLWAVSPADENTWPADEHLWLPGKMHWVAVQEARIGSSIGSPSFPRV